jgi:hypothetical protein
VLTSDDELALWIDPEKLNASYTRFMCAMLAMVRWEYQCIAEAKTRRLNSAGESAMPEPISA